MEIAVLFFLSSGLFLGWSLGANDASNVFGTAVASRMITFTTAAVVCSVFLILGAVISGAGAAHGLGELGSLNTLPGAFMAAFSAALTVFWMTRAGLPVSTTQAVVGAIVGWNLYSGSITDLKVLSKILSTWVACPILGALIGALLYKVTVKVVYWSKVHLLTLDSYTRWGLIFAGAFASYSLGANNIGNVMGVFVSSSPFTDIDVMGVTFTSVQQLFFIGGLAIAVGVFTYSKRVMMTVGSSLMPLNAQGAWVVVVAHSLVLFLFSSIALESFLAGKGLPTIPLIPVSSSQAVVGAVIGIGLLEGRQGVRQIRWRVLLNIAQGWVMTPLIAALLCFVLLFVLQNVFDQTVYKPVYYQMAPQVITYLEQEDVPVEDLSAMLEKRPARGERFQRWLREEVKLPREQETLVLNASLLHPMSIDADGLAELQVQHPDLLDEEQLAALASQEGRDFRYKWQLSQALTAESPAWVKRENTKVNKLYNRDIDHQLDTVYGVFSTGDAK
jgi:PiT family inorganic phosphate transporter